jgi:hypothetical protein
MAANDMDDALKHPHLDLSFAQVRDDTFSALAQLATIFKNKFQKPSTPELIQAPLKALENKQPAAVAESILTPPTHHKYQTRSHRQISVNIARNTSLLPRLVTPMMGQAASPRVPARTQNLSPRNLSQDDFWNMETTNHEIALGTNHCTTQNFANAAVRPLTGK